MRGQGNGEDPPGPGESSGEDKVELLMEKTLLDREKKIVVK